MAQEEKARREYERAMGKAAAEEAMPRKAMETARMGIRQATAEQKTKYKRQLQDLAARLKQAEERNQRAMFRRMAETLLFPPRGDSDSPQLALGHGRGSAQPCWISCPSSS
jgi:hypothetical protein